MRKARQGKDRYRRQRRIKRVLAMILGDVDEKMITNWKKKKGSA